MAISFGSRRGLSVEEAKAEYSRLVQEANTRVLTEAERQNLRVYADIAGIKGGPAVDLVVAARLRSSDQTDD